MAALQLERYESQGVTLLGDRSLPGGVAFGFTERGGGVSEGSFASLNLGDRCGDDPAAVAENRRRALRALGAEAYLQRLINPKQVHGDHVIVIRDNSSDALAAAQAEAADGADAIVCSAGGVPVLLCFADCVPVVLVAPGAFAVVHSGWRGTLARISAKAARELQAVASCSVEELRAYIGPHIAGADYEVSEELLARFTDAFGTQVRSGGRNLDLEAAIRIALGELGLSQDAICSSGISTPAAPERFYSYRASHGACGRHGALAWIPPTGKDGS